MKQDKMNLQRSYLEYLKDMLVEAQYARQFVAGVTYEEFLANPQKQRAVARSVEVIGEAAHYIPDSVRNEYSEINWAGIMGMGERLIHKYGEDSLKAVWEASSCDLPVLQGQIERILGEMDQRELRLS